LPGLILQRRRAGINSGGELGGSRGNVEGCRAAVGAGGDGASTAHLADAAAASARRVEARQVASLAVPPRGRVGGRCRLYQRAFRGHPICLPHGESSNL
jgi:hypothetical protein